MNATGLILANILSSLALDYLFEQNNRSIYLYKAVMSPDIFKRAGNALKNYGTILQINFEVEI